jgi:aryl-alcohol dehydrogenase-like predicted oxidoreductase
LTWGHQDDNDFIAAIHRALELGVNWIDTAAAGLRFLGGCLRV